MTRLCSIRSTLSCIRRSLSTPSTGAGPAQERTGNAGVMSAKYRPNKLQKFVLVWTKKYKSQNEIPDFVSLEMIEKSRSQARIKIANILMLLTALASFGAILSGKAAAKRGESVHQMNLDWHKKYDEEAKAKEALNVK